MKLRNKIGNKIFKLNNKIDEVANFIVDLIYPICALSLIIVLVIYILIHLVLPICKFVGM